MGVHRLHLEHQRHLALVVGQLPPAPQRGGSHQRRARIRAEHHFAPLVVPQWKADVVDAWELAGVAAYVLEAQGVYRAPTDNGYLFMAIMGIRSAA